MIFTQRSARSIVLGALVALGALAAHADTLTLTNVGNGATTPAGGDYVGPYGITVQSLPKSSGTLEELYCLDINREITVGETWQAISSQLSVHSSADLKAAALVISAAQQGKIGQVDAQLEVWSLLDYDDTAVQGLTQADVSQLRFYELEALDGYGSDSFYGQFTLETAVPGTQSSGGTAQDFLGESVPVPTPEPGTLYLLGTGLIATAGTIRQRIRA